MPASRASYKNLTKLIITGEMEQQLNYSNLQSSYQNKENFEQQTRNNDYFKLKTPTTGHK